MATFAQNNASKGIIAGKIIDQKTGEELTGAQISLENTMLGAASDVEGNFQIKNILPGTYNILCRSLGYSPKRIEKVTVKYYAPYYSKKFSYLERWYIGREH